MSVVHPLKPPTNSLTSGFVVVNTFLLFCAFFKKKLKRVKKDLTRWLSVLPYRYEQRNAHRGEQNDK
jgi:hypothetical protein